jgi:hypothetical protein
MKIQLETPSEILWGMLALLGVLAATGLLAVAFRLGLGKW